MVHGRLGDWADWLLAASRFQSDSIQIQKARDQVVLYGSHETAAGAACGISWPLSL